MTTRYTPTSEVENGKVAVIVSITAFSPAVEIEVNQSVASILGSSIRPTTIQITHGETTRLPQEVTDQWQSQGILVKSHRSNHTLDHLRDYAASITEPFMHWLEAGDCVAPDFYDKCISHLESLPSFDVVCATPRHLNQPPKDRVPFTQDAFSNSTAYRITALIENPVTFSTALFKRACFTQAGIRYPEYSPNWKHRYAIELVDFEWTRTDETWVRICRDNHSAQNCEESAIHLFNGKEPLYFLPHMVDQPREELHGAVLQLVHLMFSRNRSEISRSMLDWVSRQDSLSTHAQQELVEHYGKIGRHDDAKIHLANWLAAEPKSPDARAIQHDYYPGPYSGRKAHHSLSVLLLLHAFPSNSYGYGGTELYAYNLAKEFTQLGIHVAVLVPVYESNTLDKGKVRKTSFEGIDLIELHLPHYTSLLKTFWEPELGKDLAAYVERMNFDIAHMQYPLGPSLVLMDALIKYTDIKTAFTLHDANIFCIQSHLRQSNSSRICAGPETVSKCVNCHIDGNRNSIEAIQQPEILPKIVELRTKQTKHLMTKIDQTFVPTTFLMSHLERSGYPLDNVSSTTLGMPLFQPLPKIKSDKIRLMFLGNLLPVKGLEILLKAFSIIDAPNAELHIHGKAFNSPLYESYRQYFEKDNIFQHGSFHPSQLPQILQHADVGITPSLSENYPTVVREFFNAGVPVIGSRVGGIPELIENEVNGYLFEVGNVEELSDIIQKIIGSPEIIDRLVSGIQPVMSIAEDATLTLESYKRMLVTNLTAHESRASQ